MSAHNYAELAEHVNHNVECVGYGVRQEEIVVDGDVVGHKRIYVNAAVECIDCNVVLIDFDNPDY